MKYSTRWLVLILFPVFACAVDFNDPESVTGQDFFLSFWRSGTNWLFTCIQATTRKPVRYIAKDNNEGYCSNSCINHLRIPIDISKSPLFHTHSCSFVNRFSSCHNRLLVIVRNYKEVIMRNVLDDPNAFERAIDEETLFVYYAEYLAAYDAWDPKRRLLVYYEDLLQNPRDTLQTVLEFLEESDEHLDQLMQDYEQYKQKTIQSYHKQYEEVGGSMSKGNDTLYHTKLLSKELEMKADTLMQTNFPVLWMRYLQRYL